MQRLSFSTIASLLWALTFRLRLMARMQARPGQGLVEYALVLVLVAVTCIGIMTLMGENLRTIWYSKIIGLFP